MSSSSKARQRITALLDENSFVEIGAKVTARATDFNLKPEQTPSDGVITGYGVIDSNLVFVYSQDVSVLGGSIGEMHARKIASIYDLAIRTGAPVIGLVESAGFRLQEGVDALNAFGTIYARQAKASGLIPQITAIFGNCGGGLALIPAMTDFAFMAQDAKLYVNAPNTLSGNKEDKNDTAAASVKAEGGSVDAVGTEEEILDEIRTLVSMIPSNNEDEAAISCTDDLNRASSLVAAGLADPSLVLSDIADDGLFFETKRECAPEMATGFIRLGGTTAGVVANRSAVYDENGEEKKSFDTVLTAAGCYKAADFVRFCDGNAERGEEDRRCCRQTDSCICRCQCPQGQRHHEESGWKRLYGHEQQSDRRRFYDRTARCHGRDHGFRTRRTCTVRRQRGGNRSHSRKI